MHVALDLSALDTIDEVDALSGRVRAGGGFGVTALDGGLAARGLMLEGASIESAATVASWAPGAPGLGGIRLATPQGLATVENDPALAPLMARFGVVTSATLAVCRRPLETQPLAWRFADFAAGLAALREAAREGVTLVHPQLSDERETGVFAGLEPDRGRLAALWAQFRKPADGGALLFAHMAHADRARFKPIAQRLGGRPAKPPAMSHESAHSFEPSQAQVARDIAPLKESLQAAIDYVQTCATPLPPACPESGSRQPGSSG